MCLNQTLKKNKCNYFTYVYLLSNIKIVRETTRYWIVYHDLHILIKSKALIIFQYLNYYFLTGAQQFFKKTSNTLRKLHSLFESL